MKINYLENDNGKKVKNLVISKSAKKITIGAFAMMLTIGSGMAEVKAQVQTNMNDFAISDVTQIEDIGNQKTFENGYNFYKTGDQIYLENIDWDIENSIYFNKGIQAAVNIGEEMVEGIEAPDYSIDVNYSEMSTAELMVNAKRVYETGLEFAETGILNPVGDPAIDELRKRGIEFDAVQGGVNYYEAQGNERHTPVIGNVETLNESEMEKWIQYGEDFYTTGEFPVDEEWNYTDKNTNNLAGRISLFNKGLKNAIDNGKQITNSTGEIDYANLYEMSNSELLEVLASENWFELGVEYQKTGVVPDQIVNGSLVDDIFKSRGIELSASSVFQAGCNCEREKQIEQIKSNENRDQNIITKENIQGMISNVSLEEVTITNNDLENIINNKDKEIRENDLEK